MIRFLLSRLVVIPGALLFAHFFGYALALIVRQDRLAPPGTSGASSTPGAVVEMYGAYVQNVARGDWGQLPYAGSTENVLGLIAGATGRSLGLLAIAVSLSVLVGLFLGTRAVRVEPPGVALWLTSASTLGLAMPAFYAGSLLIAGTILYIIYGPGTGTGTPIPIQGFGWDSHLLFPTLVLMLQPAARIAQVTSGLLAGELSKQYIVAARSTGHSWKRIVRRHAFRAILAPVTVALAGSMRLLVGELIIVERLFYWPGLGRLASLALVPSRTQQQEAVLFLHPPLLAGLITVFAALLLLADLVAGGVARVYDPRLRIR